MPTGTGSPAAKRAWVGRGRLGLDADHPHVGSLGLDRGGDAGEEAATTQRDDHGLDVRALLEDLQPAGALPSDDVDVVERVDQDRAGLGFELLGPHEALVDRGTDELDVGAVGAGRVLLRDRSAVGHEDGGLDAEQLGRERDTLGVVAGAGGDDALGALLLGELGDPQVGAADLERAGALEVLALDLDLLTGQRVEPARPFHRGDQGGARDDLPGGPDVVEGHGRNSVIDAHGSHPRASSSLGDPRSAGI